MTHFVITVWQPRVGKPRIYQTTQDTQPSLDDLLAWGVYYLPERGDTIAIDAVSADLARAIPGRWIRP